MRHCVCGPCRYINPRIVVRQRLRKHVPTAMTTHVTRKELLDALFSMRSLLCLRKAGDQFFPEILIMFYTPYRKMLQIKSVDFYDVFILCYVPVYIICTMCYFPRNTLSSFGASCKVGVKLY
jgi:hypothetical protein